ncbi:MAG TPA: hypothetical protein VG276_28885 [Actinomycetes bacterium]|nr:hypothetical protein [Actinomycetes bacterium]
MPTYASKTDVPVAASVAEIQRTVERFGAEEFGYAVRRDAGMVEFISGGRRVRIVVPLPDRDAKEFTTYLRGGFRYERAEGEATKRWEQASRQRWRALALVVKAKLEAVEAGISTFEAEFLAQLVLPGGITFGQAVAPRLEEVLAGSAPASLLELEPKRP